VTNAGRCASFDRRRTGPGAYTDAVGAILARAESASIMRRPIETNASAVAGMTTAYSKPATAKSGRRSIVKVIANANAKF
jgi:hypothetical protein